MRNLSLSYSSTANFPVSAGLKPTKAAFDLDENVAYLAFENTTTDESVTIELWKQSLDLDEPCQVDMLSMFETQKAPPGLPVTSQLISLRVSPETRKLVAITASGDLTTIPLEGDQLVEVEGSVECGILAATWSPDDSLLVLVTAENKLILMTSMFDVLSEESLQPSEFGEDAPVNVGWGSKSTQFHGSLGKDAAKATPTSDPGSSPDDDTIPRISWRGDGAYFVVSSLSSSSPPSSSSSSSAGSPRRHRVLRTYDRQGLLQSTSEPVPGLEHPLAWSPSGSLIAATQRFGFEGGGAGKEGRHDLVFFERNGLRHGEFGLRHQDQMSEPVVAADSADGKMTTTTKRSVGEAKGMRWGYRVREVSWSPDSEVLLVWLEEGVEDVVQLWVIGNYHWYLKQEIRASDVSSQSRKFASVDWHPEQPLYLLLTTDTHTMTRTYTWETCASDLAPPDDTGSVAVLDGTTILLTPFRHQNVPPPMSSAKLHLPISDGVPIHLAFSAYQDKEHLVVGYESGRVRMYDLRTRALQPAPGAKPSGRVVDPVEVWAASVSMNGGGRVRQVVSCGEWVYAVVSTHEGRDEVVAFDVKENNGGVARRLALPAKNGRLTPGKAGSVVWQRRDGALFTVNPSTQTIEQIGSFPNFCFNYMASQSHLIGLSRTGQLYALTTDPSPNSNANANAHRAGQGEESAPLTTIATNCNSFTLTQDFLIFTSTSHEATFVPLSQLTSSGSNGENPSSEGWEKRKVERGSRIVVAVPSSMALVLQMPRGNLETINPRPLVMRVVTGDLEGGQYRKAFLSCRKHRIDLNVLVEHNYDQFLANVPKFVEQVPETDYINLLLTVIGRGTHSPEKIGELCDAIRVELEKKDVTKYVSSIITAYVVKSPPDYEAGLSVLLRLKDDYPGVVEEAVKYIIFLVDANTLFDIALGMYDFSLVLMIAQYAQKDPREYLPFLRELRTLEPNYQHFRIDDYLKRYAKALKGLAASYADRFQEAVDYIEKYQLHDEALRIYSGTERYKDVLVLKGNWLFDRRNFREAAIVFLEAEDVAKAMVALERGLDWQTLFELAVSSDHSKQELSEMGYRVSEDLISKKRYGEAGRVLLDYTEDTRAAVIALVQGNLFSEARRTIALRSCPELIQEVVVPGTLESCSQVLDDLHEMQEQLRKQMNRIAELRIKKVEEPDFFYGNEEGNLQNVDVMTDASMPATAFTRYTAAPSSTSKASKRTSKSKRKLALKEGAGRKGTVHEEEYLLNSITKLATKFNSTRDETANIISHLLRHKSESREPAEQLQDAISDFEKELEAAFDVAWAKPEEGTQENVRGLQDTLAAPLPQNPVDKLPKPVLPTNDWKVGLLDLRSKA